jgi:amino acid adenylation domain-containing protein/non-ribosomal peptide synthase protein (TIGR01720 family)
LQIECGGKDMGKKITNNIEQIFDLTYLQEGILFNTLVDEKKENYYVQNVFDVQMEIDCEIVQRVFSLLEQKHTMLRANIVYDQIDHPVIVITKNQKVQIEEIDLSKDIVNQEIKVKNYTNSELSREFNLTKDPLLRVLLIKIGVGHFKIIWTFHHIIMDGWSASVLFFDFLTLYSEMSKGIVEKDLIKLIENNKSLDFQKYSKWLHSRNISKSLSYWKELLSDFNPSNDIARRLTETDINFKREVDITLNENDSSKIRNVAKKNNSTLNSSMETLWGILLQKYVNSDDIVFGKVVSGRNIDLPYIENSVGLYINTIPVRVKCSAKSSVSDIIKKVHEQNIKGQGHNFCPLHEIKKLISPHAELFKTLFVFENYYRKEPENFEGTFSVESVTEKTENDFTIVISENCGRIKLKLQFDSSIFSTEQAKQILERYVSILNQVSEHPNVTIEEIDFVLKDEKRLILHDFNNTKKHYHNITIIEAFEKIVLDFPNKIALETKDTKLTYQNLNNRANQLAQKMIDIGTKSQDFVAILAPNSSEMIISILAIMKIGAVYVPIDPKYPKERIDFILKDCSPTVLLKYRASVETDVTVIDLENIQYSSKKIDNLKFEKRLDDLIYCIYTSGTTGIPKGVLITNRNVSNYIDFSSKRYKKNNTDFCAPLFTSYSFDLTITSIFTPLVIGGKIIIFQGHSGEILKEVLANSEISFVKLTPSHLRIALQNNYFSKTSNLNTIVLGGEIISKSDCEELTEFFEDNLDIYNEYGPTETTVGCQELLVDCSNWKNSIGFPIQNMQSYIFNSDKLCGIGDVGELCIAGEGVGSGYLNLPELTTEKFIDNPMGSGKLYRTGDLARWLQNGEIEYLGRLDDQIKIHGYRIEIGEIESKLRSIDGIEDCVVTKNKNNKEILNAYYVSKKSIEYEEIRSQLKKSLPVYMIPQCYMKIDSIPITRNGKIDRNSLPDIKIKSNKPYVAPKNEIEKVLVRIFSTILNVEKVGIKDNFFELGGDSIKAIRIISKLKQEGYVLTIQEIMGGQTIEELILLLKKSSQTISQEPVVGKIEKTPIVNMFDSWDLANPSHYNQSLMISVPNVSVEEIEQALNKIVVHHDMLRMIYPDKKMYIPKIENSQLYEFSIFNCQESKNENYDIEKYANRIQKSFNLSTGPLFKAGLIISSNEQILLLCAHHLIVDGISWRIILEDLETCLECSENGKQNSLPYKTTAYKDWAKKLRNHELEPEQGVLYWPDIVNKITEITKSSLKQNVNGERKTYQFNVLNESQLTKLYQARKAFSTEINDLLLTALCEAISIVTDSIETPIYLESHGREQIFDNIDLSRTIGWFTSIFPVILKKENNLRSSIISIKESLRRIPLNGLSYGIFYRGELPEIKLEYSFNFLGENEDNLKLISDFSSGDNFDKSNRLLTPIVFNGFVNDRKMDFSITFDDQQYDLMYIKKLAEAFSKSLDSIISLCLNQNIQIKTISDISSKKLREDEFAEIQDLI